MSKGTNYGLGAPTLVERLRDWPSRVSPVEVELKRDLREAVARIEEYEFRWTKMRERIAELEREREDETWGATIVNQHRRIVALEEALRDVLDCVWSGSPADRKFWRDEAVATFERAAALAQDDREKA